LIDYVIHNNLTFKYILIQVYKYPALCWWISSS